MRDGDSHLALTGGIGGFHEELINFAEAKLFDLHERLFSFLGLSQGIENDGVKLPSLCIIGRLCEGDLDRFEGKGKVA